VLVVKGEDMEIAEALTVVTAAEEDMEEEDVVVLEVQGHSDPRQSK
jgi:ribosomal silencing factor RsfS